MTDLDKPYFTEIVTHFAVIDGRIKLPVSPTMMRAYWEDLAPMALDDFKRAQALLRKTTMWMPRPSEFYAAARKGWT